MKQFGDWKEIEEIIITRRNSSGVSGQMLHVMEWQGTTSIPRLLLVPGLHLTMPQGGNRGRDPD